MSDQPGLFSHLPRVRLAGSGLVHRLQDVPRTARTTAVALQFGVALAGPREVQALAPLELGFCAGQLTALVGPSGSGKSTACSGLKAACADGSGPPGIVLDVRDFAPTAEQAIVDAVAPREGLDAALQLLTACGLGDVHLWLRRFDELSEGERFRVRLAVACGKLEARSGGSGAASTAACGTPLVLLCDEFCSGLHRRLAKAISYNLRKLVTWQDLCLVVATSNEDVLADLQPDVTVFLRSDGSHRTVLSNPVHHPISFDAELIVERGRVLDYVAFAAMHYRGTDALGPVDKVFVLKEKSSGDHLGVVVYAYGPIELNLRNQATAGRFCRKPVLLNQELRILRRLVTHSDVRGCGLGYRLVQETLPLVGTRYVECLAAMGELNPVFERAGMERIGLCPIPPDQKRALKDLKDLEIDPLTEDFVSRVHSDPAVHDIVARSVFQWYRNTTGTGRHRVHRQSPELLVQLFRGSVGARPVYYLWSRDEPSATD